MKSDDSSLLPDQLNNIKSYAYKLLHKADALDQLPTPVDQLVKSANLYVNEDFVLTTNYKNIFNFTSKMEKVARPNIYGIKKLLGLLHVPSGEILIDHSQHENKKTFIKLHEAGHGFLPHQRRLYEIMEDGKLELDPDIEDLFEREANNFASEVLFQLGKYEKIASDYTISIKTPIVLSKKFGSSIYASMRRYVQTHFSALALGVYNKVNNIVGGPIFVLRRAPMYSQTFLKKFGSAIFPDPCSICDPLGNIMNSARLQTYHQCNLKDRNNNIYTCSLHIFNNFYEIFILIIPLKKIHHADTNIFFNGN